MKGHGHSAACCTVPPASHEYIETGSFEELAGMKTYKTGPASATTAILIVYDLFGFSKQVLQGADILAHANDEHHQYQVYVPDFLLGEYAEPGWFPPDTKEKQEKLGSFFGGPALPLKSVEALPKFIDAVKKTSAGQNISKWGILGLCWGGKVASLCSGKDTIFSAAAEAHPAMVDPADAENISIPMCILASKDEDAEAVKGFESKLSGNKYVETFSDQVHGWMAGRGDLQDHQVRKEYERGYQILLKFFHEHL